MNKKKPRLFRQGFVKMIPFYGNYFTSIILFVSVKLLVPLIDSL